MNGDLVTVPAVELERLGRAVLDYQRRTGASDPTLVRLIAQLLSSASVPREWLSMVEAARQLGVSLSTVRRRVADGSLPSVRLGRRVLISAQDVSGALTPVPPRFEAE